MDYKDLIKRLRKLGFVQSGGTKHELWVKGDCKLSVPRSTKDRGRFLRQRLMREAEEYANRQTED